MTKEQEIYYGKYAAALLDTEKRIVEELKIILKVLTPDAEHCPFEHLCCRIKNEESVQEKLEKKGFSTDARSGIENLSDIIGIRVVTHFVGDIYTILEKIRESTSFTVIKEKDYIANPKENGYRSFHVIIRTPFNCEEIKDINIEIQLRTIAMDCWAALEHQMKYKKNVNNSQLIIKELKRCSDEMASTDLTMQTIRDVLS